MRLKMGFVLQSNFMMENDMNLREYLEKFNLNENDTVSVDVGYTEVENVKGTELSEIEQYLDYNVNMIQVYSNGDGIDIVFEVSF